MDEKQKERLEIVRKLRPIDDALFEVLAQDKGVVEEIIRTILSDPELVVESVTPQDSVPNLFGRAVRLDALCHLGDGRECNVEVQRADSDDHLRRVRYNSSGITWTLTPKGTPFKNIPNVCVIYISEFDFLEGGRTIYHIDKVVRETNEVVDDGMEEIFVNTTIDDGTDVSDLMRCFLQANVSTSKFPKLSNRMDEIKNTEKGVNEMCSVIEKYYGEDLEKARTTARAEGIAEGIAKGEAKGKAEGMAEGKISTLLDLIASGIITFQQGAAQLGISEAEMEEMAAAKQ